MLTFTKSEDQRRFAVTTFATNLSFPTSILELADGSLLVAANNGSSLFGSTSAQLLRLVDNNSDGYADGPPTLLASSLPGLVTSVRRLDDIVVALSAKSGLETITLLRVGPTATSPLSAIGSLRFDFPSGFEHSTYAISLRRSPTSSQTIEIFFNLGAKGNSLSTAEEVGLKGDGINIFMDPVLLEADSVHRLKLTPSPDNSSFTGTVDLIAKGLRNAAGMVFSANGDLYLQDNGIDGTPRDISLSADELNIIPVQHIGQVVPNFGFPNTYIDSATGLQVGDNSASRQPVLAFLPIGSRRSEGLTELALAPPGFGEHFRSGMFASFIGMVGRGGVNNLENPIVFADPTKGEYYHFIPSQLLGNPYGLASTSNSLYISDLSITGNLSDNTKGVIYRISPESDDFPPTPQPTAGQGLSAQYFNNITLSGTPVLSRVDSQINFRLGNGSPAPGVVNTDLFSARWTGSILPTASGQYSFFTQSDDGVRLWINDQPIINNWTNHALTENSGTINLEAGKQYNIKLEYYENAGSSDIQLLWQPPDGQKQLIPSTQLRSTTPATPSPTPTPIPTISLSVSPAAVSEDGNANLIYTFSRTGSTTNPLTVYFSITGTADASDYSGESTVVPHWRRPILFAAGSSTATIIIDPTPDTVVEPDESVVLTLTSGTGYSIGSPDAATGTIRNDDFPPTPQPTAGQGLSAQYFNNITLSGTPVLSRVDSQINFRLGNGSPAPGVVNTDLFSARWTGSILPTASGQYSFFTQSDDGVRLWINDQPIINNWTNHALTENSGTINLEAGKQYNIKLEYYENAGSSDIQLLWQPPGGQKQLIPSTQLRSTTPATPSPTPTPIPTISLSVSPAAVSEDGNANLIYTFARTGSTTNPLTVYFSITGTAIANDYSGASPGSGRSISFAAGSSTATLIIDPTPDTVVEPDESVLLTLSPGTGYSIGSPATATGTIRNDDSTPIPPSPASWSYDWESAEPLGSVPGILLAKLTVPSFRQGEPNLNVTALRVDLKTPGLSLSATGRIANWQENSQETLTQTTRNFIATSRQTGTPVVAAINTAFFSMTDETISVATDLKGLAVNQGVLVSPVQKEYPGFVFDPITGARIIDFRTTPSPNPLSLTVATTGMAHAGIILKDGIIGGDDIVLNARTALGLSPDNRFLTLFTVDRSIRSPSTTTTYWGATIRDSARLLFGLGSYNGLNLDGGGSTQLAWLNPGSGQSELLNSPLAGFERHVGSNLGITYVQP